ncbi:hypothetical protein ETB97_008569 [Aspergillus alliaceus]|uniref:Uncharacterized protein n=1 Tax=Petromyces alliaceus TaxID=209559 RepID=A0A8H5ZWL4_PETAA|nr:hypothetical protein ETB97_008569 [Aspergillus burnettii]
MYQAPAWHFEAEYMDYRRSLYDVADSDFIMPKVTDDDPEDNNQEPSVAITAMDNSIDSRSSKD